MNAQKCIGNFFSLQWKRILWSVIVLGMLAGIACCSGSASRPALDPVTVESELEAFQKAHREAVDAKDIEGILQFYSPNLITVTQGEPIQYGKDWLRPLMQELYQDYDFHEEFKLDNIKIIDDRVVASYSYLQEMTPLEGGNSLIQKGKGMCILKKSASGTWQFEWNSYNTEDSRMDKEK